MITKIGLIEVLHGDSFQIDIAYTDADFCHFSILRKVDLTKEINMSDDPTLPPRQPNTPRTFLKRAWAWLQANPIWLAAILGMLAGLILPPIARALFG